MHRDIVIIGGGIVGICIGFRLKELYPTKSILIIEKESSFGVHCSGRNSGVLHAGLYYKPESLKAKVCVGGAKRLKEYISKRNLVINKCGKLIIPQRDSLDSQLDILLERGIKNGAEVHVLNNKEVNQKVPSTKFCGSRGIWSPNTAVVDPKIILKTLAKEIKDMGVECMFNANLLSIDNHKRIIHFNSGIDIKYGYMFNTAGVNSLEIAKAFGVGSDYDCIPFKGVYWELKSTSKINIPTNIYPVPDLELPFLGVHFTPNASGSKISIGPTATLALGREHYGKISEVQPLKTLKNIKHIIRGYATNKSNFRRYVHQQAFQHLTPIMLTSARKLIPDITASDVVPSVKQGIRPQLFNIKRQELVNDFICVNSEYETHVINAISPSFTASFELADLIISRSNHTSK